MSLLVMLPRTYLLEQEGEGLTDSSGGSEQCDLRRAKEVSERTRERESGAARREWVTLRGMIVCKVGWGWVVGEEEGGSRVTK